MNHQRQRIISALVAAASCRSRQRASSHREAPFITTRPKVDGTDFYMFNSYEAGRAGYVTLIANYQPFEDPAGRSRTTTPWTRMRCTRSTSTTPAAARRR